SFPAHAARGLTAVTSRNERSLQRVIAHPKLRIVRDTKGEPSDGSEYQYPEAAPARSGGRRFSDGVFGRGSGRDHRPHPPLEGPDHRAGADRGHRSASAEHRIHARRIAGSDAAGAVGGGVAGAVLGHNIGDHNKLVTVLGAAGGALLGNQIEKQARATKQWELTVRYDNGSTQVFTSQEQPFWHQGDRVRYYEG